jgi:hypothetical protein
LIFLVLTDGTVAAYDDVTLAELWKTNVGSGFNAPPRRRDHERQNAPQRRPPKRL